MIREKWLIILSLVLGLAAAGVFYLYSGGLLNFNRNGGEKVEEKAVQMRTCVAAAGDIERRTLLTEDMLVTVEVPLEHSHPNAVEAREKCVGRITRDRLIKGETVLEQNLRDENTPSDLSFVLPEGMRAITMAASVTSGVGNMLRPGDYVDIIVYLDEKVAGKSVSFTLLRKTLVLATDNRIYGAEDDDSLLDKVGGPAKDAKGYQSITLAASPRDCVKLNLAESTGRMKLVLHAPDEPAGEKGAEVAALNDIAKEAGFRIPRSASEKTGAACAAKTKVEIKETAASASGRENKRAVHIMRGVELQTVFAAAGHANTPGKEAK